MGKRMIKAQIDEEQDAAKRRIWVIARTYHNAAGSVTHVGGYEYFESKSDCEDYMEKNNYYSDYYYAKPLTLHQR